MKQTIVHIALSDKERKVKIEPTLPVLFLAGPIRNAPKWQEEAIQLLIEKNAPVFVAAPLRSVSAPLREHLFEDADTYETFERQRAWEQYYLYAAAKRGCIVFWLPQEIEPKEHADKIYAHITMMELGEWIARCKNDPSINLVVGTDGNFPEWRTILFELESELPQVPICSTLEEAITTALRLAIQA